MNLRVFSSASALVDFVNDGPITQAKIVKIMEIAGQWYLFWYT